MVVFPYFPTHFRWKRIPLANVDSSQHDLYSEHLWTTSKQWKHRHIGLVLPTLTISGGFCIGFATQVATRGSILYFVIADLANINPMQLASLLSGRVRWNSCERLDRNLPILSRYEKRNKTLSPTSWMSMCCIVNRQYKSIVGWPILLPPSCLARPLQVSV